MRLHAAFTIVSAMASEATPALIDAVNDLRDAVQASRLPLRTPGQAQGLQVRRELVEQLDDYVLPRLNSIDAPVLAVVGGSTGAGKSTLINSIVASPVSRTGVLRPTTTVPVLVHHPDDTHWFRDHRILPGLARVTGEDRDPQPGTVRLARSRALPAGLALLDAPDIDSVVKANRDLAAQLLAAADLWIFVTTAARYADAVPWGLLRTAADRGTAVAIVLDRVAPESVDEIRAHLVSMLREQGLGTSPVFVVPESELGPEGLLPAEAIERIKNWLIAVSSDSRARAVIIGQTLQGALASLDGRTAALIEAVHEQVAAGNALVAVADSRYEDALRDVEDGMRDGTLLRGEVLARWQEFVGTGEFFRNVESTIGKWRDKVMAALKGNPAPAHTLGEALHTGVAALVMAHGEAAAGQVAREWRTLPGGEALLERDRALTGASTDFRSAVEQLVRAWQGDIFEMVRTEGGNRRTNARVAAYGVNGIGLFLMLVTFAHTGGLTGAEVGIAGGTSVLAQRVLEAIFGDQAVRDMAARARRALRARVEELYQAERVRYERAAVGAGSTAAGGGGTAADVAVGAERLELTVKAVREAQR